jgi:DUF4097 and DUF4098 domain-containing protein YvlB
MEKNTTRNKERERINFEYNKKLNNTHSPTSRISRPQNINLKSESEKRG